MSYATMVNGKAAAWTPEIRAQFDARVGPLMGAGEVIALANYYTPRPYVDRYNQGSDHFGFTYTVNPGQHVCQVSWRVHS